ncbi:MAG TPA: nuclear transport factor 2 family protein [Candidatus Saccharimonadales bacterium]|nr:nuclear transport factor 2 family protein [Candidatus Saccharimonadales bacterium]
MTEKLARQLIDSYVEGWVNNHSSRILGSLSDDCFITESHGPTYRGLEEVKRWIKEWHHTGVVDKWEIDSFFFAKDTAFFEWSFACTIGGKTASIDGASVVQFEDDKIYHIHEYRMTMPEFRAYPI